MAHALDVPVSYLLSRQPGREQAAGLQEDGAAFMMDFMSTSEGLELSRAFTRIRNAKVRRKIVELVRADRGRRSD